MRIIRPPGSPVARSHQAFYTALVPKTPGAIDEVIIVHHVTEDSPYRLQLEVERRYRRPEGRLCYYTIKFERLVL
jgi:hypothetical protein